MMNRVIRPLAAAVGLALISVSAHAALVAPAQGTTVPASTGLYLEAFNATTGATELVNLSYAYTDITGANTGNLNTASGPAWTSATNPSTGVGSVEQLNFGTIANASAGAFTNYTVVSAATPTQSGITGIQGATVTSGSPPTIPTNAGLTTVIQDIQTEIAAWASQTGASGTFYDPNGSSTAAGVTGPSLGGTFGNGLVNPGFVGTATDFYSIIGNNNRSGTTDGVAHGAAAATAYDGFWFLSTSGQLSYNLVSGVTPPPPAVPLPAAVWLLGSGLLGLIGVGRRNRAAA
jgi:hypothetical protein